MNWIKNLSVLICSILIALIIFEIGLRINGRYDSQASQKVGGVDTILTHEANTQEFHSHPDLEKEIIIRFGQYGSRITEPGTELKARKASLFGDSYTENRRIESKFTFGEILNGLVEDTSFLNFGVDGFGLEQSYAHYLKKKEKLKLDKVFYLLCSNDLRNTYEAQLFDRNKMAKGYAVLNPGLAQIPWQIKFASKMHITYLLIEGYFKGIRSINIQ